MFGNVNRGLLATAVLLAATAAPIAGAVSDEVAVQLLERLGELEKEVSHLRGENETLQNELQGLKTTQREGFLEVDERVSGLEKPTARPTELPALEDPVVQRESPRPPQVMPEPDDLEAAVDNERSGQSIADPEDRKALAPVGGLTGANSRRPAEKVEPDSPDSYYYYGTEDKNKPQRPGATVGKDGVTPAVTTSTDTAIPDEHKAKAEYNQAYKALVNNPASAVPAFRAFLDKYPSHELAANAQYWLGEALYAQKDYAGATTEFMVVLKKHKSSPKAPGAALKLGYSFYELKQWDFARRTLEDTIRFFPDSNAATLAKHRLEKITAEGH